ncbi:MAG: hypothetical protein IT358_13225 [Gemmatimonadaceae bacterium]|nr:hypothetical protein [Gemmatimonadota bacterium]MCC7324796.1 hypothetical protein [Gemmatimonadaceae bacterium]
MTVSRERASPQSADRRLPYLIPLCVGMLAATDADVAPATMQALLDNVLEQSGLSAARCTPLDVLSPLERSAERGAVAQLHTLRAKVPLAPVTTHAACGHGTAMIKHSWEHVLAELSPRCDLIILFEASGDVPDVDRVMASAAEPPREGAVRPQGAWEPEGLADRDKAVLFRVAPVAPTSVRAPMAEAIGQLRRIVVAIERFNGSVADVLRREGDVRFWRSAAEMRGRFPAHIRARQDVNRSPRPTGRPTRWPSNSSARTIARCGARTSPLPAPS